MARRSPGPRTLITRAMAATPRSRPTPCAPARSDYPACEASDLGPSRSRYRVELFVGLLCVGAAGAWLFLGRGPAISSELGFELPWWSVAVGFFVAEAWAVHVHFRSETHSISLNEIALVPGLLFLRPATLILAQLLGAGLALGVEAPTAVDEARLQPRVVRALDEPGGRAPARPRHVRRPRRAGTWAAVLGARCAQLRRRDRPRQLDHLGGRGRVVEQGDPPDGDDLAGDDARDVELRPGGDAPRGARRVRGAAVHRPDPLLPRCSSAPT